MQFCLSLKLLKRGPHNTHDDIVWMETLLPYPKVILRGQPVLIHMSKWNSYQYCHQLILFYFLNNTITKMKVVTDGYKIHNIFQCSFIPFKKFKFTWQYPMSLFFKRIVLRAFEKLKIDYFLKNNDYASMHCPSEHLL